MGQLKQKDAVVQAVKALLGDRLQTGVVAKGLLADDDLTNVRQTILDGIVAGKVEYNKDIEDLKAVQRYVHGMVDNHLRKAKELNGGKKYVPERRKATSLAEKNGVDASLLPPELQLTLK